MNEIERRLEKIGIKLPDSPSPLANYVPVVRTGNLIYLSGVGPTPKADGSTYVGKLGLEFTTKEGYEAARLTGVNLLARLKGYLAIGVATLPGGMPIEIELIAEISD